MVKPGQILPASPPVSTSLAGQTGQTMGREEQNTNSWAAKFSLQAPRNASEQVTCSSISIWEVLLHGVRNVRHRPTRAPIPPGCPELFSTHIPIAQTALVSAPSPWGPFPIPTLLTGEKPPWSQLKALPTHLWSHSTLDLTSWSSFGFFFFLFLSLIIITFSTKPVHVHFLSQLLIPCFSAAAHFSVLGREESIPPWPHISVPVTSDNRRWSPENRMLIL